MAFSYGFYNSLNGDRKYNAEQFSVLISCLITDGVLDNWGDMLMARPGAGGLSIVLGSGRAWFNDTWNENDADIPFDLDPADPLLPRIDTLVLEVDRTVDKRVNRVFISKGTPATNAIPVTLLNGPDTFQHALAYITVEPNAQEITADKIQILVGTEACPFITGILEQASIEQLFSGWEYQFDTWFDELQMKLSGDVAANLQRQIDELSGKIDTIGKYDYHRVIFRQNGTWVCPDNIVDGRIDLLIIVGGGGGGGGSFDVDNVIYKPFAGGAGLAGQSFITSFVAVNTNQTYQIVVGPGGNGGEKGLITSSNGILSRSSNGSAGAPSSAFGFTASGGRPGFKAGALITKDGLVDTNYVDSTNVGTTGLNNYGNGGDGGYTPTYIGSKGSDGGVEIHYRTYKS